jgi:hypothetical protein
MKLSEFNRKMTAADLDPNKLAAEILEERSKEATDLNRAQLRAGKRKDNTSLGTYRPFTIEERLKKGLQVSFVDLRFTGSFQDKMDLQIKGNTFDFPSSDWKFDKLVDKYGEGITGLSDESKEEFMRRWGRRDLVHNVSQQTGIGIK